MTEQFFNDEGLSVRGLTKRYGDITALGGLDLSVPKGEVFGLLGPNGAGKTTAIHMIAGLIKPDLGSVSFGGRDLAESAEARKRIGLCPQHLILWERLSCLEQLRFMGELYGYKPKESRERAMELLVSLGLADKAKKEARTLSGGMQRRLNIALALVNDPSLVIFDEPEAGLDPQSRAMVRDFIRAMADKRTVIVTTHNMDEAERMADRVAILDHGVLLALDTPQALRNTYGEAGRAAPDLEYVFLHLTGRRLRD